MASKQYGVVVLGGGNSAGYLARQWVKAGGSGRLAIVGEENVRPITSCLQPASR